MKKVIDINSKTDLEALLLAIIRNEDIQVGEVKPIPFVLKFKGEDFQVKDGYISADFADLLVTFKKDYRDFLVRTIGKTKARETQILFKVEDGSVQLDFLNDLPQEFWDLVGKMDGTQITITAIVAILGYFSHKSWKDYLDSKKELLSLELTGESNTQSLKVATDAIELLRTNKKLEVAKNRPIKKALSMLSTDDELEITSSANENITYRNINEDNFNFNEDEDDVITNHKEMFNIKGFIKEPYGWNIKIEALNKKLKPKMFWAVSKLVPEENLMLFTSSDNSTARQLEVTVVKNRNKVVEAYIVKISS